VNHPGVLNKLRDGREFQAFDDVLFKINARHRRFDMREFKPDAVKNQSRVDFVKAFDRQKPVQLINFL
jgi:hypothetical protein